MANKAHCITFYSYKGGSGRSTTLVNTVMHLRNELEASPSHPILIVDADLESAGLTYFFNCDTKFTQKFSETVHTGKILDKAADALTNISGDIIFGRRETEYAIPSDILAKYDSLMFKSKKPSALLNDILIPQPDINVFRNIIECHYGIFKKNTTPPEGSIEDYIEVNYRIRELADLLIEINEKNNVSEEEKQKLIKTLLINFLPSRRFLDVSKYFEAESGTVLFLGADVGADESVARNGAATAINMLLRQCAEKGFRAVVFDSGAGTQSTPHVLHSVSDAIVYCMRPTQQFLKGTRMQLRNYRSLLEKLQEKKRRRGNDGKPVILLPTAVPESDKGTLLFHNDSFELIEQIIESYSNVIDDTFCNNSACLHEVSLFKWREHILGASFVSDSVDLHIQTSIDSYSKESEMPADAVAAIAVYRKLAERIRVNL